MCDGRPALVPAGLNAEPGGRQASFGALREAELAQAVREARADYEAGRIADRTIDDHLRRLDDEI